MSELIGALPDGQPAVVSQDRARVPVRFPGGAMGRIIGGMRIRSAHERELPAVLDLADAFYREGGFQTPRERLAANLVTLARSRRARIAVAAGHDTVVGFAITTPGFGLEQGNLAELQDLYITPPQRGRGLGARLIADAAHWALAHGCRELELVVAAHGADTATLVDYYRRHGFKDEDRRLLTRPLAPPPDPPSS